MKNAGHPPESCPTGSWSRRAKLIASIGLAFHLFAVFVGPWSSPPPSTQLSRDLAQALSPYIKLMALDNGYRFFAPDPGPSHLTRYELRMADGSTQSTTFPDLANHWPRLFYHRHFMLSEMLYGLSAPMLDRPPMAYELSDAERAEFDEQQSLAKSLESSIARYLLRHHPGASQVRLFTQTHAIPGPVDVQRGLRLDDPSLYHEYLLGQHER